MNATGKVLKFQKPTTPKLPKDLKKAWEAEIAYLKGPGSVL
jgi:hypothetical protein